MSSQEKKEEKDLMDLSSLYFSLIFTLPKKINIIRVPFSPAGKMLKTVIILTTLFLLKNSQYIDRKIMPSL